MRSTAILSAGIGVTGLVTYAYFSLASHSLSEADYGSITLLWSAVFITVSVLYRPVEQMLSHTIADRATRGQDGHEHLRVAAMIQVALCVVFLAGALIARVPIRDDLFDGSQTLYWVLVVAVLAYAVSYFARGFLAGSHRLGLYAVLVLLEAIARCLFALAAAVGIASGLSVVALGIAAAPILSLAIVPLAFRRQLSPAYEPDVELEAAEARALDDAAAADPGGEPEFTLSRGAGFAVAVVGIMLAEQAFLNAGPLIVKATEGASGAALAGFTFNVLLVARAPLHLFQAVQTAILPHLTRLHASGAGDDPFRRSVNVTLLSIAAFAAAVALVMLAIGPSVMDLVFGGDFAYGRFGLVLISLGMGLYLAAATINQALLARSRARAACACWLVSAAAYVGFLLLPGFDDRVFQVELGYVSGALLLCGLLYAVYRRSHDPRAEAPGSASVAPIPTAGDAAR